MWTAFVVALALGVQSEKLGAPLVLLDPRFTFGPAGATRPDGKFLPGDTVHLSFDVGNLKFDGDSQASYRIAMEVANSAGEMLFRQKPHKSQARNVLGGKTIPCRVQVALPPAQPAGSYTVKVTIEDTATKQSQSLTQKFEVLPAAFGLVHLGTSATNDGMTPVPAVGAEGGVLYVTFAVVGFDRRGGKNKQPDLSGSFRVLDENGKATTAKPFTGRVNKEVAEEAKLIPLQFGVTLNRAGRFTLELTATDAVSGKTAKVTMPLKVVSAN
jgi:hypothetical protein